MIFKVDEILKAKIQKNRYNKQKWSKIRCLDTFLYVTSIYIALFSIFYVINKPTFSLFYGNNGAITTSGRILTLAIIALSTFLITYIPHFLVHTYLLFKTGKNIITRTKETISIEDETITYTYSDFLNKTKKYVIKINFKDLEKISYMEEIKKVVFVGENTIEIIDTKNNKLLQSEKNDTFDIFAYFKPDLLKELEERNIKIEINFCF